MHEVHFQRRSRGGIERLQVLVPEGTTLLESARRAGLPLARGCGGGALCGRCGVVVLAGGASLSSPSEREADAKRRNRVPDATRLACRSRVQGPVAVTADYW